MTHDTLTTRALAQPTTSFTITVSRPLPVLRSNGGHGNRYALNAARQDAKNEAKYAVYLARTLPWEEVPANAIVNVQYTEILGKGCRAMDDDNLVAAMKPYRDGIALALGINDKRMRTQPTGTPQRGDASAVVCVCWWASEVAQ